MLIMIIKLIEFLEPPFQFFIQFGWIIIFLPISLCKGGARGTMEDISWWRFRCLSYEKQVISTGCLMTALAPWNWEIGSTAIESVVSRFWRFAGGGEAAMGDDGKRRAGSTFLRNRVRNWFEIFQRHGRRFLYAFGQEVGRNREIEACSP
jgi:hypothetical protein